MVLLRVVVFHKSSADLERTGGMGFPSSVGTREGGAELALGLGLVGGTELEGWSRDIAILERLQRTTRREFYYYTELT